MVDMGRNWYTWGTQRGSTGPLGCMASKMLSGTYSQKTAPRTVRGRWPENGYQGYSDKLTSTEISLEEQLNYQLD